MAFEIIEPKGSDEASAVEQFMAQQALVQFTSDAARHWSGILHRLDESVFSGTANAAVLKVAFAALQGSEAYQAQLASAQDAIASGDQEAIAGIMESLGFSVSRHADQ